MTSVTKHTSALLLAILAATGGSCTSLSLKVDPGLEKPADLGPLPAMPTPPRLEIQAVGESVCMSPDGAVDLADHFRRAVPSWRDRVTAMYEFYRSYALSDEAGSQPDG